MLKILETFDLPFFSIVYGRIRQECVCFDNYYIYFRSGSDTGINLRPERRILIRGAMPDVSQFHGRAYDISKLS
jgi:hypothetical protein